MYKTRQCGVARVLRDMATLGCKSRDWSDLAMKLPKPVVDINHRSIVDDYAHSRQQALGIVYR